MENFCFPQAPTVDVENCTPSSAGNGGVELHLDCLWGDPTREVRELEGFQWSTLDKVREKLLR
ncbi:unnamed protein product, partial [Ilex paraguariensis]